MSRLAVRTAIETELAAFCAAQVPPVLFVETINKGARPPRADIWVAAEFNADYVEKVCYSAAKQVENGSVLVSVYAKGGDGYSAAVTLADAIQDHFTAFYGSDVEIVDTVGANEITNGDARGDYGVEVELDYQHYFEI